MTSEPRLSAGLIIDRLGAQGDGIAETPDGPVYVPLTLPGETVRAEIADGRGRLTAIVTPSPQRVKAPCQHFGTCGGCAVQHMQQGAYLAWKRELVAQALAARGLDADVAPLREIGPGSRRRAVFAARRTKKSVILGYHGRRDSALVDIAVCPVLAPAIVQAIPGLKQLVAPLLTRKGEARVAVTLADNGLDVAIDDVREEIAPQLRARLAGVAGAMGLLRLAVAGEIVAAEAPAMARFGGIEVQVPSGTFLQASRQADEVMAALVCEGIGKAARAARVADLFAGVGTLTLPLATIAQVHAIDSDRAAIAALEHAIRHASGIKPVNLRVRDLFLEPLAGKELDGYDAVVFDPPRAGARAQAEALAASKVPCVVAVSCNPATLARDMRILVDGGYRITSVTPVDQFLYSPHVEVVAVLRR